MRNAKRLSLRWVVFAAVVFPLSLVADFTLEKSTAADLASTAPGLHRTCILKGWSTLGDGLGGVLYYDPASDAGTNSYSVLKPNSYSGRWLRLTVPSMPLVLSVTATNTTLTAGQSGAWVHNQGATNLVQVTLPSAAAGLRFLCINLTSEGMRIVPADTNTTLRISGTLSSAGGSITSMHMGDDAMCQAINTTNWIITPNLSLWTIE